MPRPIDIANAYIATWNEADDARRQALLDAHWVPDACYDDPLMRARGSAQLAGLVGAVHHRFPGFRFALRGAPDGHGDFVRLAWSLGPAGAEAPIEGSDVIRVDDGRIREVIGFIDRAPG